VECWLLEDAGVALDGNGGGDGDDVKGIGGRGPVGGGAMGGRGIHRFFLVHLGRGETGTRFMSKACLRGVGVVAAVESSIMSPFASINAGGGGRLFSDIILSNGRLVRRRKQDGLRGAVCPS
jgi:hypothetical protein